MVCSWIPASLSLFLSTLFYGFLQARWKEIELKSSRIWGHTWELILGPSTQETGHKPTVSILPPLILLFYRLWVVPIFPQGYWSKWNVSAHENRPTRVAFPAWGDFHACSHFVRSTIPEEIWGLLVVHLFYYSG